MGVKKSFRFFIEPNDVYTNHAIAELLQETATSLAWQGIICADRERPRKMIECDIDLVMLAVNSREQGNLTFQVWIKKGDKPASLWNHPQLAIADSELCKFVFLVKTKCAPKVFKADQDKMKEYGVEIREGKWRCLVSKRCANWHKIGDHCPGSGVVAGVYDVRKIRDLALLVTHAYDESGDQKIRKKLKVEL